jgi:hypothetical protein
MWRCLPAAEVNGKRRFSKRTKLGRPAARSPGRDGAPAVARRREVAEAVQAGLAELRAAPVCSGGAPMPANRGWPAAVLQPLAAHGFSTHCIARRGEGRG